MSLVELLLFPSSLFSANEKSNYDRLNSIIFVPFTWCHYDTILLSPIRQNIFSLFDGVQELTTAPVYPLIAGVSVIALFICMPRLGMHFFFPSPRLLMIIPVTTLPRQDTF